MIPGRWLPTLITAAVGARVVWLAGQGLFAPERVPRLSEAAEYRVVEVRDAVHLVLQPVGPPADPFRLRLLAIEPTAEPSSAQGKQARDELAEWVLHQTVSLQLDRRQMDDAGQLLAYVFCREQCVNEWLVRKGDCRVRAEPCDYPAIVRQLRQAEVMARQDRPRAGNTRVARE